MSLGFAVKFIFTHFHTRVVLQKLPQLSDTHFFQVGNSQKNCIPISGNGEILSKNDKIVGVSLRGTLEIYDDSTFQPQG